MVRWLEQRQLPLWSEEYVPALGLVACYEDQPVAMAFLRRIEGGIAMIDGMIADPQSHHRHEALDLLTEHLIAIAAEQGLSGLICLTELKPIVTRAQKHGFRPVPDAVLSLSL